MVAHTIERSEETTQTKVGMVAGKVGELQPISCEYISPDQVNFKMQTATGDIVMFSVKTAMMIQMVNMSVALLNSYTGQMLRDLDILR